MLWIFPLAYLSGFIIAFGIATWMQHRVDLPYLDRLQPEYQKAWHSPATVIVSILSWLGVIVIVYSALHFHGKVRLTYSNKPLWNKWLKNHNKL